MKLIFKIISALILIVLPYFAFLWIAHDFNPRFLQIDRCLDDGGRWDYENDCCVNG